MRSVLIDTELLVLLVVGSTDTALIEKHKRTQGYEEEDYQRLLAFLLDFNEILVTPNILTEASNLLRQGAYGAQMAEPLRLFVGQFREDYVASRTACGDRDFPRVGLADAATLHHSKKATCVLTADLNLYLALQRRGRQAVNFHHMRAADWASE